VVSAFVLDRTWGLARGFDFYYDAFTPEEFQTKDIGLVERRAGESLDHTLRWLASEHRTNPRKPFFLWLHLYDPHNPYDPPEPFRSEYSGHPYDGEIAYADHELGRLITWLKSNQLYSRTLIVALSDHGESLGEHGEHEHGFFVYNATVHIPLIVKPPAGRGIWPARISASVETTAVAPTILRLSGLKDEIDKQFTSPPLLGEKPSSEEIGEAPNQAASNELPAYSETFYTFNSFGWSPLHSLETSRYHFIDAPRPELYDVAADPDEKNNLASQQSATIAVFKDKLQSMLERNPYKGTTDANAGVSPDALEKLRALGYVAYHSPVSPEALAAGLPDPKDKLDEFNTILTAEDAIHARDFSTGEGQLDKLQQRDPNLYIVPFLLAETASRRKDWEKSASEFRRCLELNANFDQAMTGLGRALFFLGNTEEAKHWTRKALERNPLNYKALYELGSIEAHSDKAAAIADYEKAVAIQGNFAPVRRDLGMLYFEQQNYLAAAKQLSTAAELGVNDARIFNFLGICYDRTGRLSQAVDTFHRALRLDDNLAEAHLNLGFTYHRLGRETLASREYQRACELKQDFCKLLNPAPRN
jgi:Tfp pilus assembly protein PilF